MAKELKNLGAKKIVILRRGVKFIGDTKLLYKANIFLRTALRFLVPVIKAKTENNNQLYKAINYFQWDKYFSHDDTISVNSQVFSSFINNSKFASQLAKDAIVDFFKKKYNARPNVDTKNPKIRIDLHLVKNQLTLSLDSSGESLHRRGYRKDQTPAPLNEVLAAGLILLSEWHPSQPFVDPMCGSGTLPIEAALIANDIPPGYFRHSFGFKYWKTFDKQLFLKVLEEIKICDNKTAKIVGADISFQSINIARNNAKNAELENKIDFIQCSINDFQHQFKSGIAIINPPYGERLKIKQINKLYTEIGDNVKRKFTGFKVWILSGNKEALKYIGLRTCKKLTLFNGALECKYHQYEVYSGSKKVKKQ